MNRYPSNFQTVADQCMFCSKTLVPKAQGEDRAKTPPRWLTNSGCIAQALSAWCDGAHKHQQLVGTEKSVAEDSMLHASGMYLTILKEMTQQLQSYLCVNAATERLHVEWEAEDDVKGGPLDPHEVKIASHKKIRYLWDRNVHEYATEARTRAQTGRNTVGLKWINKNKSTTDFPRHRSRLVCTEVRHKGVEQVFSAAPPLEALRVLICVCCTPGRCVPGRRSPVDLHS